MKSMTGYGEAKVATTSGAVEVALRSVNGRFLEVKFHLPPALAFLEKSLREILGQTVSRGTLSVTVSRKVHQEAHFQLKMDRAKSVQRELHRVAQGLGLKEKAGLSDLLVFSSYMLGESSQEGVTSQEQRLILQCFKKAVQGLDTERTREGARLRKEIVSHLGKIEVAVRKIQKLRAGAQGELTNRLSAKISELGLKEFDRERLAQEVVWTIEKSDIQEELTRLLEHLKHMRNLLAAGGSVGKKLDFYTQELLREVNTIGSKANNSGITELVVDIKTWIDQIKEQVQNIE